MIRKILAAIGIGKNDIASSSAGLRNGPYKDDAPNVIYELLFCDRLDLFKNNYKGVAKPPWSTLFEEKPDLEAVAKIANDHTQESRVRILAFNLLRSAKKDVPRKELLATLIEVRLPGGLDTLAVFTDGGARYINHTGKMIFVEGNPNDFEREIQQVIITSKPIVAAIGPWEKDRLAAPQGKNIRMTFLVSDGLYFGEGPMDLMQKESLAAPLINAATSLFLKLLKKTTKDTGDAASQGSAGNSPG